MITGLCRPPAKPGGTATCPGSSFRACPCPSSLPPFPWEQRPLRSHLLWGQFRAPCWLRPKKPRLPSWPSAAPLAGVAMATAERLAPTRALKREEWRGPAWTLQHHPGTRGHSQRPLLTSWLLQLYSPFLSQCPGPRKPDSPALSPHCPQAQLQPGPARDPPSFLCLPSLICVFNPCSWGT